MTANTFKMSLWTFAVLGSVAAAALAAGPGDWPGWLGIYRDGKSADTGLLKQWPADGPKLLWKTDILGKGFSSPTVVDGTTYITGDVGDKLKLFAFDGQGKVRWSTDIAPSTSQPHEGSRSTPVVDGGNLYIISSDGVIACHDIKDGRQKWTRTMTEFGGEAPKWGYSESVLIHKNLAVVTPGGKNCIVALDKATGKTVWMSKGFSGRAHYGSCIAVTFKGVEMIIAGTGGGIVGVSAKDGQTLWSNPFAAGNTANCPTPAFADGYVFWANGYGKGGICLELSADDGKVQASQAWTTKDMDCHHGGYVIDNGLIYGNNGNGWACLDLKTGQTKWKERGVGKGSLCLADGMLYLFSENRGVIALAPCSPEGLKITGQFSIEGSGQSWAHPVVTGGKMYLRYGANLYCYDVKGRQGASAPAQ